MLIYKKEIRYGDNYYGGNAYGKTAVSKKISKITGINYLSQDLVKMGLIRSNTTNLTAYCDELLTPYLWNITKEIIKTAIENKQDLIVEGCYVPINCQDDFDKEYRNEIRLFCLNMSKNYVENHFDDIVKYENVVENRKFKGDFDKEGLINDNEKYSKYDRDKGFCKIEIEKFDLDKMANYIVSRLNND